MKLNKEQYNEMVEKLASEIVEGLDNEVEAGEQEPQMTEEQIAAIIEAKKAAIAKAQAEQGEKVEEGASEEEKAAAVYEYAMNKIAACQDMYSEGMLEQQACIETLAEAGIYDENGFNKEAAESSDEHIFFTNKIAEHHESAMNKIAAAEECYAEAQIEANAAMEVLAGLGYELV